MLENIHAYTGTIEAVYMEIGLQAGAKLAIQLLETGGGNNVLEK